MKLLICIDVEKPWSDTNPGTTRAIAGAAAQYRANGGRVLWVRMGNLPEVPHTPFTLRRSMLSHFRKQAGCPDAIAEGDLAMGKTDPNMFKHVGVVPALYARGFKTFDFAGFMTAQCVDLSCRAAIPVKHAFGISSRLLMDMTADGHDSIFFPEETRKLAPGVMLTDLAAALRLP